ncbi:VPLPA-CTERM sorting domain-containing protein [Actibacterium sp. 188UL27-1]|uniref:VPLPA-CTERM sorting domain-containing protein n=1 Tax=Actibacterium sp. 188UL27-1 TaxID=2786961 RepID=UPI001959988C|nr:VPLPA-CTERM sorting domain-containing protein [Actibacterium sp. 188UL27-1]MBM7066895.1 VPLPA-CTERM sorting domain-containing protein [Actibacterium sp. 188UL27-1]
MLRLLLAVTAALTISTGASRAATMFADDGTSASFSLAGLMMIQPPVQAGSQLSLVGAPILAGGTQEFAALQPGTVGVDPSGDGMIDLLIAGGDSNAGQTFTIAYDRTGLGGSETGTLEFALGETVAAEVTALPQGGFDLVSVNGLLDVSDSSGFYDDATVSFSFSAVTAPGATIGTYTFAVSTIVEDGNSGISPIPLPAGLPLLGAALIGLGMLERRRKTSV